MRLESFKNYCPECGRQIQLMKVANGHFRCPDCGCECRRNWLPWLVVGVPAMALSLFVIGSLPGVSLWKSHVGLVYSGGAVVAVLCWFWGHRGYTVVEHGREFPDEKHDKGLC